MSIVSGFKKVKNYIKETDGYKLLSRWTSSDTVDVNGKTLTEAINGLNTSINGKANSVHTHGNGDITSLDASKITSGTIDIDRLPQGALDRLIKVADDTARFKLTTKDVQLGDSVKVTSTKKMYIVVDETKLSSEDGYEPYTADSATSVPWSGVTGKPSTYTPSSHTHTTSQITNFPTSMPANGGNSSTVNGHTVNADVPSGAKFTDTDTWRPLGTTADTACAGNDSRLSNARPASDVYAWAKASSKPSYTKSEVGLGNVDNTADSAKSVKYATSAGSASSSSKATGLVDYGATTKTIQIGYSGDGISGDAIKYIAGYTTGNGSDVNAKIKDVSKDALKSWLGLGSLAYSSATIPTIPSSLPANGGNASTVNGHTVNSNVPANAKFTDTNTWRGIQNNLTSTSTTDSLSAAQGKALNDKITTLNRNLNYTTLYSGSTTGNVVISKSKFAGYQFYVIEYAYGNSGPIFDILTLYTPSDWEGTITRMLRATNIAGAQYIQNLYEIYSIVGDSSNITIRRGNMYYNTLYPASISGNVSGQATGIQIFHVFGVGYIS